MRSVIIVGLGLAALVGACTPVIPPEAATMPRTPAGTPELSDEGAMQLSSYALAAPSRTANDPVTAARAIASIDYLAGELYANPRWERISLVTKGQMIEGRAEERAFLGIDPRASSQEVLNRLLGVSHAMEASDVAGAKRALTSPVFTFGPDRTLALLTNLPYLEAANVAAQKANQESYPREGRCGNFPCL